MSDVLPRRAFCELSMSECLVQSLEYQPCYLKASETRLLANSATAKLRLTKDRTFNMRPLKSPSELEQKQLYGNTLFEERSTPQRNVVFSPESCLEEKAVKMKMALNPYDETETTVSSGSVDIPYLAGTDGTICSPQIVLAGDGESKSPSRKVLEVEELDVLLPSRDADSATDNLVMDVDKESIACDHESEAAISTPIQNNLTVSLQISDTENQSSTSKSEMENTDGGIVLPSFSVVPFVSDSSSAFDDGGVNGMSPSPVEKEFEDDKDVLLLPSRDADSATDHVAMAVDKEGIACDHQSEAAISTPIQNNLTVSLQIADTESRSSTPKSEMENTDGGIVLPSFSVVSFVTDSSSAVSEVSFGDGGVHGMSSSPVEKESEDGKYAQDNHIKEKLHSWTQMTTVTEEEEVEEAMKTAAAGIVAHILLRIHEVEESSHVEEENLIHEKEQSTEKSGNEIEDTSSYCIPLVEDTFRRNSSENASPVAAIPPNSTKATFDEENVVLETPLEVDTGVINTASKMLHEDEHKLVTNRMKLEPDRTVKVPSHLQQEALKSVHDEEDEKEIKSTKITEEFRGHKTNEPQLDSDKVTKPKSDTTTVEHRPMAADNIVNIPSTKPERLHSKEKEVEEPRPMFRILPNSILLREMPRLNVEYKGSIREPLFDCVVM